MGCASSSAQSAAVDSASATSKPSTLQVTDTSSAATHTLATDGGEIHSDDSHVAAEEEKPENNVPEKAIDVEEANRPLPPPVASSSAASSAAPSANRQPTVTVSYPQGQAPAASKPISSLPPLKKGFILKEGHLFKNWKNRFFVLEAGTMTYYESSTDAYPYGVRKKGEIILKGTTLKMSQNIITISFEGDVTSRDGLSTLTLEIRYPTEREEWFQAIASHIAYFNAADL